MGLFQRIATIVLVHANVSECLQADNISADVGDLTETQNTMERNSTNLRERNGQIIQVFTEVQIHGLTTEAGRAFNGRRAYVKQFDKTSDQYEVVLGWNHMKSKEHSVFVKPSNLTVVSNNIIMDGGYNISWQEFLQDRSAQVFEDMQQRVANELIVPHDSVNLSSVPKWKYDQARQMTIAIEDIKQGEIVLAERPLIEISLHEADEGKSGRLVWEQFLQLEESAQLEILKLSPGENWHRKYDENMLMASGFPDYARSFLDPDITCTIDPKDKRRLLDLNLSEGQRVTFNLLAAVYETNSACGNDKEYLGIGLPRFNHSCEPNLYRNFDHVVKECETLMAVRDIRAGEVLSWNYIQGRDLKDGLSFLTRDQRREKLNDIFHFDCMCTACTQQPQSLLDWNDEQRTTLGKFYEQLLQGVAQRASVEWHPSTALSHVKLVIEMLDVVSRIFISPNFSAGLHQILFPSLMALGKVKSPQHEMLPAVFERLAMLDGSQNGNVDLEYYKKYFIEYQKTLFQASSHELTDKYIDQAVAAKFGQLLARNGVDVDKAIDDGIDFESFKTLQTKFPCFMARHSLEENYYLRIRFFGKTSDDFKNVHQRYQSTFRQFGHLL